MIGRSRWCPTGGSPSVAWRKGRPVEPGRSRDILVGFLSLQPSITPLAPSPRRSLLRPLLLEAVGANAVREIGLRVLAKIGLDLAPVALVVANPLAPGANGQQPVQRLRLLQCFRHAR